MSRLADTPTVDLRQTRRLEPTSSISTVKQAPVLRSSHPRPSLSSYPHSGSLFWSGPTFASSQGLAGISDRRHPAASSPAPKSMSTVKHSAGKVLHNQMGFVLTEAFFFFFPPSDCLCYVDPIWPLCELVIYQNWIFRIAVCLWEQKLIAVNNWIIKRKLLCLEYKRQHTDYVMSEILLS